jgi:hypothetical protein
MAQGESGALDKIIKFIEAHSYEEAQIEYVPPAVNRRGEILRLPEIQAVHIYGECKWSVFSAWNIEKYTESQIKYEPHENDDETTKHMIELANHIHEQHLKSESILDIEGLYDIEVYSSEPDMGFAEHYILKDGKIILDDTREYYEYFDEDTGIITLNGGYAYPVFKFDPNEKILKYDSANV